MRRAVAGLMLAILVCNALAGCFGDGDTSGEGGVGDGSEDILRVVLRQVALDAAEQVVAQKEAAQRVLHALHLGDGLNVSSDDKLKRA